MNRLFRQEAVDFRNSNQQWGGVASLQTLSSKIIIWFLTSIVVFLLLFLFYAEYTRKETAIGYLTPTRGTAKIFASRSGVIRQVHVTERGLVKEGQPLLTIDLDEIASEGMDVNATLLDSLTSQRGLLETNIKSEEHRSVLERDRLAALLAGLETEIAQLRAQLNLQNERLTVANSELDAGQQLRAKGYVTAVDLRRRQMITLENRQALSALSQQIAAKQNQLAEAQATLTQLPTLMLQKVQTLKNQLSATEQRIAEIKGRRAYVIRAPISGRVATLQATAGQTAHPQRLQLEIVPSDAILRAELFVPARAIGFVQPGLPTRILFDAFPYQHFGTYNGTVESVSQTILTSVDAAGPIKLLEPAYKVAVNLERQDIDADGKRIALQPDMLLRSDILLERRSLMSWIISPLRSVRM